MSVSDAELRAWLDRQAIEDLIHRYSDSVTRGDYEHTAELFAPDAVWEEVGGVRFDTAREFIDYLPANPDAAQPSGGVRGGWARRSDYDNPRDCARSCGRPQLARRCWH